ncbi:unnamed protein product [Owenia fusiformis]|uniref:Uncharacterized protein n=1 Tax=Owenia fusiformis TaxID=6347 RepID=A0A8S4Q884_OWEFU|nr:unnamed protein product [Owenia fusiformis]
MVKVMARYKLWGFRAIIYESSLSGQPHRERSKGLICHMDILIDIFNFKDVVANTDEELKNRFNLPFEASIESRSKLMFKRQPIRYANFSFLQPGDIYFLNATTRDWQGLLYEVHTISFDTSLLATQIDLCLHFSSLHN